MTNTSIYPALCADATLIRELLDYNPDTGIFTWKFRENDKKFNAQRAGKQAGSIRADGYLSFCMDAPFQEKRRHYFAHRIAWLHYYGKWPDDIIDHIDRNKTNNAISNLRDCSAFDNARNHTPKKSRSGHSLVIYQRCTDRWRSFAIIGGKRKSLGSFKTMEEAIESRLANQHLDDGSKIQNNNRNTKRNKEPITQKMLFDLMKYDSETGVWQRILRDGSLKLLEIKPTKAGYVYIGINNQHYMLHRLAWLYTYGELPEGPIDHIDGDRANNKISNLRLTDFSKNSLNTKSKASRGAKKQRNGNWAAFIKNKSLGTYKTQEEAFAAYDAAYFEYMGEMPQPRVGSYFIS